jgi:transposase
MAQLHKRFADSQVRELLKRYVAGEVKRKHIEKILGISKRRFFQLVKGYRESGNSFSVEYKRKKVTRKIPEEVEDNILYELTKEKEFIDSPEYPIRDFNYSHIRDILLREYKVKVSVPTIIARAKKYGFYKKKKTKKVHDREVVTNYVGELIQHDSSHHRWSPTARDKWYLITSIDDYSRFMLYAKLFKKETSWTHIKALEAVSLKYGLGYSYYVDCHSTFRFVQGRDSLWRKHYVITDGIDPQWKQLVEELGIEVIYALSPQAKGKVERPYRWLQDRIVRNCAREDVDDIAGAQRVLKREIYRYNYKQVHSTTGEVPYFRFKEAQDKGQSLFREFVLKPPYKSIKDVFCLRLDRVIGAYRNISINTLKLKVHGTPRDKVKVKIYPLNDRMSQVRIWCKDELIDIHRVKNSEFKGVHF